ncbi:phosphorylated adapter RNA export protein-like [Macrosteles quadrilineatus]|uniref:phosphorylated adapter RNA export protein-like n=1 Tax=Macrosteles quadrilineatus TaxID=74068 RepID=UPI0023E2E82E|nr:phosphorylated adapter RNA export protein-like [Macrosteles quadrilineatus]
MDETSLEEGEIPEAEDMLAEPDQFSISRATREPQRICSDESSDNSDNSDDDSDAGSKPKKVKPLPPPTAKRAEVPNKYKVWSIALQEETLMENLHKCDVEANDRSRSVESYNYKPHQENSKYKEEHLEYQLSDEEIVRCDEEKKYKVGSKRRHGDIKSRLGKRGEKLRWKLPNLAVTAEDTVEDVAEDIATKLRESKANLILNIVLVLGKEKAIELYNITKEIEDNGGIYLMNEERRRTSGGVYLLMLKRDDTIQSKDMKKIFADDLTVVKNLRKRAYRRKKKAKLQDLKETLIREKLLNLNTMVGVESSGAKQSPAEVAESNNLEEGEVELNVTNPPPSPATDQDTPPSRALASSEDETEIARRENHGRTIITYEDDDDDYLDIDVDDMDVF